MVRSAWDWLRRQVVQDVPAEDALCEFDCRKAQCSEGDWATCERRLGSAAGELTPPQPSPEAASEAGRKVGRGGS